MHDVGYFTQLRCTHNETIISLQHFYPVIVTFSAPAIHIIWTEPLPLSISSLAICARQSPFLETCPHPLGCERFLTHELTQLIYLTLSSDVLSQSRQAVGCRSLCTAKV